MQRQEVLAAIRRYRMGNTILSQIKRSLDTITYRFQPVTDSHFFVQSDAGLEKLDAICMQFIVGGNGHDGPVMMVRRARWHGLGDG